MWRFTIALLILCAALSCSTVSSSELRPEQFIPALEAAQAMPRLHSLLVSHQGEVVLEKYFNGKDANDIANIKSVSKSVVSALVGIAIEQGHIGGIDTTIEQYFPNQLKQAESAKKQISIEDLLTMRSGLETTSNRNYGAWVLSKNWVEFALQQPLQAQPGTGMQYSTGSTHLLSAIITQATGESTLEFARNNLTKYLGFHLVSWPQDPQGIYFGGNDMEMTPRQMLAFGEMYLNKGKFNGKQIVSERWIEESFKPKAESRWESERYYGYGWWIREMAGYTVPYAWGYGGQFMLLVPELELVIISTASSSPGDNRRYHTRRMYDLVEEMIIAPAALILNSDSVNNITFLEVP